MRTRDRLWPKRKQPTPWFQWQTQVRGLTRTPWIVSLTPFTLQSLKDWEWGCRSAVLLLKLMEGGYGRRQMCRKALCFNSRCRLLMTKMSQTSLNGILPRFWRTIASALLGCILLALVIFVCFQLHTRLGIVALFCLLTIVILSLQGRFFVAL